MKKLFVSLLCVVMLVTFMPGMAFADAAADGEANEPAAGGAAKIEETGTEYASLNDAVEAAADGQTVTLLRDVEILKNVNVIGKKITLNCNTKKIYNDREYLYVGNNWSLIRVGSGGDLTITGNGTLQAKNGDCYALDLLNGGKCTIENGTFKGNISTVYVTEGELTINGGHFSIQQLSSSSGYQLMLNCLDRNYTAGTAKITVTGGTFNNFNPADNLAEGANTSFVPEGYLGVPDGDNYEVKQAAVQIGETYYPSLQEAVKAVPDNTETEIMLLRDTKGNGVSVPGNKKITFNLGGFTYDVDGTTVGSPGTQTNGFQLLANSDITFKNGTITSNKAIILIQNYSNLTLQDVTLDGTNTNHYVLSNNNGNTALNGKTNILAAEGKTAFDVCWWPDSYPDGPKVTVNTTGKIVGKIEFGQNGTVTSPSEATLDIRQGNFEGEFIVSGGDFVANNLGENVNISGGTFSDSYKASFKEEYLADGMDTYGRVNGTFSIAKETQSGEKPPIEPTEGFHWEKDENGNYVEVKDEVPPYIPPTNPVQKPVIEAEEGATVTLSKDGTTATIVVDNDAVLKDVILNGQSLGAVTEVTNLKTGDKLVIIVETAAEKNARLKAGVENTSIRMYYKKDEIGKGWIKLRFKKAFGYKVDNYEIFRSAKKKTNFGDKAWFVTKTNKTTGYYKNGKSVKKGTRYYYKMRGVRRIAGETVYTQWSNIVMRTGR